MLFLLYIRKGKRLEMIEEKRVTAIILVAGNSTRYGQNRNKNFEMLHGKTVLEYSLEAFQENAYIDTIIIGAKQEEILMIQNIIAKEERNKPIDIVVGGKSRQETVHNCIKQTKADIVIIHDGARPVIQQNYINQCIEAMKECKGVTVGVPSKDTIKVTDENNFVVQTTQRSNTWIVQTPQCFEREILLAMHEKYQEEEVTDDCMLLEKSGEKVKIIQGDYTNIKITTYEDIGVVENFIAQMLAK